MTNADNSLSFALIREKFVFWIAVLNATESDKTQISAENNK